MPKRVLIADDEPAIVISLDFLMRKNGFDTDVARDGEEALAKVDSFRPDLVLLDLMLPFRSGLDVCRALRSAPGFSQLKVIMLTAKGGVTEQQRGLASGADAYMVKPFSTQELVAQVCAMLDCPA